ncbi:WYL domain-containing protein [Halobacteriovorax sp. HFRX-2_2]|uniref:WYL domain-containing protein n=1 Tax=unclassified Halobacteriovorax TaxID=2639665 RepID=UPI00371E60F1
MTSFSSMEDQNFWNILFNLEEIRKPISLVSFLRKNHINRDEFYMFYEKSHFYGLSIDLRPKDDEFLLMPLSWRRDYGDILLENTSHRELIKDIQAACKDGRVCEFTFLDHSKKKVRPWRVVLSQNLYKVISEDVVTKKLITIDMNEVDDIEFQDFDYASMYSRFEIEEYINALRHIDGSDQRLVLKLNYGFELTPISNLIFLGHPYSTTNQYGEIIWAASVEKSLYLFDWLYSMRDQIEILEPSCIKEEFEEFCQKRRNAA